MEAQTTQWLFPLTLAALLGSVVSVCAVLWLASKLRRERRLWQAEIAALNTDVTGLCAGAVGVGKRLARIERGLRLQDERQDKLEMRDSDLQAYGQATRLAHRGADAGELVRSCGISQGEAELIVSMHGMASNAA